MIIIFLNKKRFFFYYYYYFLKKFCDRLEDVLLLSSIVVGHDVRL
jgi:hypothetical protein